MSLVWIFLLAIGLSLDTFAVSVSSGIICKKIIFRQACKFSVIMALFHGIMPLLGWMAGAGIHKYIEKFDHWIAAGLLVAVAIKMIVGTFSKDETKKINPLKIKTILTLGLATSIDALAVGFSIAFFQVNMIATILIISSVAFLASMIGLFIGKKSVGKFGKHFEVLGGIILLAIAAKILFTHLS